MNDVLLMKVTDGTNYIWNYLCSNVLRQEWVLINVLLDVVEDLTTLAKFGYYVKIFVILEDLEEAKNTWVVEVHEEKHFCHKLVNHCIVHQFLFQYSDASNLLWILVFAHTNFSISTCSDKLPDRVSLVKLIFPIEHRIYPLTFNGTEQ